MEDAVSVPFILSWKSAIIVVAPFNLRGRDLLAWKNYTIFEWMGCNWLHLITSFEEQKQLILLSIGDPIYFL